MEQEGHSHESSHDHHAHHGDEVHAQHAHLHPHAHIEAKKDPIVTFLDNKVIFAILVIAILVITVYARLGLMGSQGLFEPDGFFYYSVVRATINNHLMEPQHLGISGFSPAHNFIGEAPGLPYLTVIFYLLIGWAGVGYLAIMRLLPVLFGVFEAILAYFIAKELSDSKLCGLLAMLFIGVSAGNIARTAALVYRGDTFISVPVMLGILVLIKGLKLKDTKKIAIYALAAAFILSTGILVWNGSPYIIAIYMLSLLLLLIYSFISWKPELAKSALIFTGALLLTGILQVIYIYLKAARTGLALSGFSFLEFYIPLLAGALLCYYIMNKRGRVGFMVTTTGRFILAVVVLVIGVGVVALLFTGGVRAIATSAGVYTPAPVINATTNSTAANISYAVGATTQELQKPSWSFIFASFSLQIYLLPIAIILFLLFNRRLDMREESKRILTTAFIVLFAYLAVTAYLQYNAIRYNSLLSIPLAIFAAYAVYSLIEISGRLQITNRAYQMLFALAVIAVLTVVVLFWVRNLFSAASSLHNSWYLFEGAIAVILILAIVAYLIISLSKKAPLQLRNICILAAAIAILFCCVFTILESYNSAQADGINPSFLSAMTWLKANTPTNATVLALWPDGSVVEGWGNRTSYMDSVGGENGTRIYYFARYLVNSTSDSQYLYSIGKPEYIVARQYWLTELSGLIAEGVPKNPSNYSFSVLGAVGQPQQNATTQLYFFGNGYYNVTLVSRRNATNSTAPTNYSAYLGSTRGQLYKISRVTLYNTTSHYYGQYNSSSSQLNYSLMIFYSGTQIQGAIILTNALYSSNLFKLVWLCNDLECPYSNSTAKIAPVYINNDTRIYKVTYT